MSYDEIVDYIDQMIVSGDIKLKVGDSKAFIIGIDNHVMVVTRETESIYDYNLIKNAEHIDEDLYEDED